MQLAVRTVPKENRRMALIDLTESGRQVCTDINYTNDHYLQDVLKDFTEEELETILKLFGKLTRSMFAYRNKNEQEDASG
jgi:DNA-binding MarR family transcriptional regulator